MFVQKETINEHFKNEKAKTGIGHGQFLKKLEMIVMLESGKIVNLFVKKNKCLTILMVLLFYILSLGKFLFFSF